MPDAIGVQDRVATKNIALENAERNPRRAAIDCVRESSLAKIGRHAVELPPTNTHFVSVRRVDANRRLICGIANNVVAIRINVDLIARVRTELRDQSGRRLHGWE